MIIIIIIIVNDNESHDINNESDNISLENKTSAIIQT